MRPFARHLLIWTVIVSIFAVPSFLISVYVLGKEIVWALIAGVAVVILVYTSIAISPWYRLFAERKPLFIRCLKGVYVFKMITILISIIGLISKNYEEFFAWFILPDMMGGMISVVSIGIVDDMQLSPANPPLYFDIFCAVLIQATFISLFLAFVAWLICAFCKLFTEKWWVLSFPSQRL